MSPAARPVVRLTAKQATAVAGIAQAEYPDSPLMSVAVAPFGARDNGSVTVVVDTYRERGEHYHGEWVVGVDGQLVRIV